MLAPNRVRLQLDERREQLLALGRLLFSTRTYDDLTIDEIAKAANMSKGLLYHYFPSKRHFFLATIREAAAELFLRTQPDRTLPPADQLRSSLDGFLDFVDAHGATYAMVMRGGLGVDPEVSGIVEKNREAMGGRVFVYYGIKDPPPLLRHAVRSWIGSLEGAGLDRIDHKADVDRELARALMMLSLVSILNSVILLQPEAAAWFPGGQP